MFELAYLIKSKEHLVGINFVKKLKLITKINSTFKMLVT